MARFVLSKEGRTQELADKLLIRRMISPETFVYNHIIKKAMYNHIIKNYRRVV